MTEHRIKHVPALDGIRGLAVIAVLLFHGDVISGGFLGVDAFFVLSGFLITSLLLAEVVSTDRVDLSTFWTRRARRLLPALFVTLLAVALFASLVASSDELGRIRSDSLATLGYVANWHSIAQGHGYWELFQAPSPLEHTWSLAIEEQFYLVWPLVAFGIAALARRRQRRRRGEQNVARMMFFVSMGLATVSVVLMIVLYASSADPSRVYFGTDTRASSILFGAALASWVVWRPTRQLASPRRFGLEVIAGAAAITLGVAWVLVDGQASLLYEGGFLFCGLAAAVVIAAVVHPQQGPISRILSVAPLRAIGIISYGLYLWHWPIFVTLTEERVGVDGAALFAIRAATSLALAWVSYVVIERPIRRGTLSGRKLIAGATASAVVCAAAVFVATIGATSEDSPVSALVSNSADEDKTPEIRNLLPPTDANSELPRILIAGDSVAGSLADATAALQSELGVVVGDASRSGCVLQSRVQGARGWGRDRVVDIEYQTCDATWLSANQLFQPDLVLVVYGNAAGFTELSIDGQWSMACSATYDEWYEHELTTLVKDFTNAGRQVVLTKLPPMTGSWLPDGANDRIACINALNEKIARRLPDVSLIDLDSFVCPAGVCQTEASGQRFRPDGMHFGPNSALVVARWLLTALRSATPDSVISA